MRFPNPFKGKPAQTPEEIIHGFAKWAGGIGAAGSFALHSDVIVVGGIWAAMILMLAQHHGVKMDKKGAVKIAASLVTSAGTFWAGITMATGYFAITGIGVSVLMVVNVGTNAMLTCAAGYISSMVFADKTTGPNSLGERIVKEFRDFLEKLTIAAIIEWLRRGGMASPLHG